MAKTRFDKIAEDITELKVVLGKQEVNSSNMNKTLDRLTDSVEVHIKRTNAIEELVEIVRTETAAKIESELLPIKAHIHFIKGALWAIGGLIGVVIALHKTGALNVLLGN